jgi:hypothetical protein
MNEIQIAQAALTAIEAFEQLPKTSPRASAWQLFCVAAENALSHQWSEDDLSELLFRISRDRENRTLNGNHDE